MKTLILFEVFAYAHDEYQKLSGQLLMDVANRLPGTLKRRYLDHLARLKLDLNRPGFDSLREFIVHELNVMSSDYAQTFFKNDEKEKPRGSAGGRGPVRVRQVAVKSQVGARDGPSAKPNENGRSSKTVGLKQPPLCFVCNDSESRHFLANCPKFSGLSKEDKKRTVMNAGRCLNCLAVGHFARRCSLDSKCSICGPGGPHKHASALHDVFVGSKSDGAGAADMGGTKGEPLSSSETCASSNQPTIRKLSLDFGGVLLRTSAVKVINPKNGKSTFAYAQHDTGSQATLISERLKNELNLKVKIDCVTIRTLADQTTKSGGLTEFKLQSFSDNAEYPINDALVVPDFTEEERCLPHAVKVAHLKHFEF